MALSLVTQFMVRLVEQGVRIADEAGEETISIVYDRYLEMMLLILHAIPLHTACLSPLGHSIPPLPI